MSTLLDFLRKPCPVPDVEFQAFLDHYPVSKHYLDLWHNQSNQDGVQVGLQRALFPPRLLRLFDWQVFVKGMPEVGEHPASNINERRGNDPSTVLSGTDAAIRVLRLASHWATARTDRVLVFMGMSGLTRAALGQTPEVQLAVAEALRRHFGRLYTVGNDAADLGFRTMPLGLVEHKVRRNSASATAAIAAARLDIEAKPLVILAAFGQRTIATDSHYGPLLFFNPLKETNTTGALRYWSGFEHYRAIPMAYPRRMLQSGQVPKVVSRQMAAEWLKTPASQNIGLVAASVPGDRWWSELSKFRFLLSPLGDEIQAPKNVEALLVLTVPVIQHGIYEVGRDLQGMGFPIVAVDEWEEVTAENLTRWWQELSPRLLSFRANCLTTEGFWRIVTGEIESCH